MSSDELSDKDCPLCLEALEVDDIYFYPCKCEYQICRFCWHRIRTDENGLCPACRQPYPEHPADFKPLTPSEVHQIKIEKQQKRQLQRLKICESRKHLSSYRVLQKNLVYVVGLSSRVADPDILKKPEYFGKYGKIIKVAVGASPQNGTQAASCTAYVTFARYEDALKAIQAVNNVQLDGRIVKASLGTTKYCSNFLRHQPCHKTECMYLHYEADLEISFTKEEMHLGRHSEYEKKLIEAYVNRDKFHTGFIESTTDNRSATACAQQNLSKVDSSETVKVNGIEDKSLNTNASVVKPSKIKVYNNSANVNAVNGFSRSRQSENSHRPSGQAEKKCRIRLKVSQTGSQPKDKRKTDDSDRVEVVDKTPHNGSSSTSSESLRCPVTTESHCLISTVYANNVKGETEQKRNVHDCGKEFGVIDLTRSQGSFTTNAKSNLDIRNSQISQSKVKFEPTRNDYSDDELGFDPFSVSLKGLTQLMEEEKKISQMFPANRNAGTIPQAEVLYPSERYLNCVPYPCKRTANFNGTAFRSHVSAAHGNLEPFDSFNPSIANGSGSHSKIFESSVNNIQFSPKYSVLGYQMPVNCGQSPNRLVSANMRSSHLNSSISLANNDISCRALPHQKLHYPTNQCAASAQSQEGDCNSESRLIEWQDALKTMLPCVNIRFVQEQGYSGYPENQQNMSAFSTSHVANAEVHDRLSSSSNSKQQTPSSYQRWMMPPPGFSSP